MMVVTRKGIVRSNDNEQLLARIYYDVRHPASFASPVELFRASKEYIPTLKYKEVLQFLQKEKTYTLHKQIRRKITRRKTIVNGIDDQWQGDLVSLINLKKENENYSYLLTVVDVFSRFGFVEPLKSKRPGEVVLAFKKILRKSQRKPTLFQSDDGTEFKGEFRRYLADIGIRHFSTSSDTKAALVERFNRTLKGRMFKYFTANNTLTYIDVLPRLVQAYNNRKHRIIGMTPSEVTAENESTLWKKLYKDHLYSKKKWFKFAPGDRVRITKLRLPFKKGYLPGWTTEIFTVLHCLHTAPQTYILRDNENNILKGAFYSEELNKVL